MIRTMVAICATRVEQIATIYKILQSLTALCIIEARGEPIDGCPNRIVFIEKPPQFSSLGRFFYALATGFV